MKNDSVWNSFEAYGNNSILPVHNNPTLFSRWLDNLRNMETQILCDTNGEPIPDSNRYQDEGGQVWGPMRWPYKAATEEASYSDPPITFLINEHMVAIGSTGWDWKNKQSRWLGYDFDSIAGHAEGVGVSQAVLDQVVERAPDWVEIIRSTRGDGRHLYIIFQEPYPKTITHTEHAALARAFLPLLSTSSGLDLSTSVDVCGSVLWIHHRNATKENRGYSLIRPTARFLTAADCPLNWEDHIEVINGGRSKVRVRGYFDEDVTEGDELDEMTQAHTTIKLDDEHHKILDELQGSGYTCMWVNDHNLAQTHTAALKIVYDKRETAGKPLKGIFDTNTRGGDPGKPNCFMRPKVNGAWDIYRFGQKTKEHCLWDMQGVWTHTTYNYPATLTQIAAAAGGFESPEDKQLYLFNDYETIATALALLRSPVIIPDKAQDRTYTLRPRNDGKLVVGFSNAKGDEPKDFPGWAKVPKRWERLVVEQEKCTDQEKETESTVAEMDEKIRMLKCVSYEDLGSVGGSFDSWVLKDSTNKWIKHPRENIGAFLQACGHAGKDVPTLLGGAIKNAWTVINEPFQPEFPGGRVWNLGASQYVYKPLELAEGEVPYHPSWDKLMNHCGSDLDQYIPNLPWCKDWGITCGGDYLKAWVACLLRYPFCKLPYLFMYGPQNTGKSSFHEAISTLVTRGVDKADRALTSTSGYNGELVHTILGVIDEADISKSGSAAYNKLKEWTTALTLSVHAKYKQVYETRSTLHFVQMANSRSSLPVMAGDSRITAMNVPPLLEEIPKDTLFAGLKMEGPAFMRTLMDWTIPEATGRMKLPVMETRAKDEAMASTRSPLEAFIGDCCFSIPGACVTLSDFYEAFKATLEAELVSEWTKYATQRELMEKFPVGLRHPNQLYIGNLSLTPVAPSEPYFKDGNKLVKQRELENGN